MLRPTTPPRPAAALHIDAAAMLRSYESARKGVAQLATLPLWRNVGRQWPFYAVAAARARADLVKASKALGVIR